MSDDEFRDDAGPEEVELKDPEDLDPEEDLLSDDEEGADWDDDDEEDDE